MMVPDWLVIVQNARRVARTVTKGAKRACGHAWNSPNTVLGLLGAIGGRGTWRRGERIAEVCGGWLIRLLRRLGWADAITLGDVVLYADSAMPLVLRAHEMVHVRQGRRWGPLFLPLYALESVWQWARTGDGYRSNRFERAAYEAED